MNRKSAMVVGATGLVGSELLKILLESDYYRTIVSLSRKAPDIEHPSLVKLIVDFDRLEEMEELISATDIYCCMGTTIKLAGSKANFHKVDFTYPVEVAKIALKNEAENFFLITAMGAKKSSSIYYNRVKGEVEEAIKGLGFPGTHIFRPSLLLGDRRETRNGEKFAQKLGKTMPFLFSGPLSKFRPIEAKDVAKGMFSLAQKCVKGINVVESEEIKKLAKQI